MTARREIQTTGDCPKRLLRSLWKTERKVMSPAMHQMTRTRYDSVSTPVTSAERFGTMKRRMIITEKTKPARPVAVDRRLPDLCAVLSVAAEV